MPWNASSLTPDQNEKMGKRAVIMKTIGVSDEESL